MPELPEVETIVRGLRPRVVGRTVTHVRVLPGGERALGGCPPDAFMRALTGRRVEGIDRRGKYLLFALDDGRTLVAHLRMTGALLHRRPDDLPDAYTRAVLSLGDGAELRFADMRKFGTLQLVADAAEALGALGVEPLSADFTVEWLTERARGRTAPAKSFLLNQAVVAGVGNIYADEALFEARLDPRRPAGSLTRDELARLRDAVVSVLESGVRHRGVSFRNYRDAQGEAGANQAHVRVFRRTGQPCDTCGAPIARTKLAGRSTHFCPQCQG